MIFFNDFGTKIFQGLFTLVKIFDDFSWKLKSIHIQDLVIEFVQGSWLAFCSCRIQIGFRSFVYIYEVEQEFIILVEVSCKENGCN